MVVFSMQAKQESEHVKLILRLQNGVGFVRQDFALIQLYSLHLGVYNYELEQYKSMPSSLYYYIYEMFYVNQMTLTGAYGNGYAPKA
jgi:hypothetical protein